MRQAVENQVPTKGGVGITQELSRLSSKDGGYGNIFPRTPVPGFSGGG
jgi:hypothetical protein